MGESFVVEIDNNSLGLLSEKAGKLDYNVPMGVRINPEWQIVLTDEFSSEYFAKLTEFVRHEYQTSKVYPEPRNILRAFDTAPLSQVRVVILGQDPYHGVVDGRPQAQGLSFSVPSDMALPPSLQNIFKELQADVGGELRTNGDLSDWAEQGVLLLNATLTVRASQAGSHQGKGWEQLTDAAIRAVSDQTNHTVFILWGSYARRKKELIDVNKHLIIESAHPSPLSAHRGFFGSKPFSQANQYLRKYGAVEIDWLRAA